MNYLITGINGFVGSNMANLLLNEGHNVHGLLHSTKMDPKIKALMTAEQISKIKYHIADLNDVYEMKKIIQNNNFDGIFHFAAQSHPPTAFKEPVRTFQANVMGTVNLIDIVEKFSPNTILQYCSTSEVYGNLCKDTGILKENDPLIPNNPYGVSKAAGDLFMQERMMNGFIKGIVTRAFSHTGPMRGKNFSISSDAFQIAKMMLNKQEKVLKVGNLKTKRAVMDVRDCVNAYYLLMKHPKAVGEVFNICNEDIHEMQYYTDELINISKLEGVVQEIEPLFWRNIDIDIQIGDNSKINNLIGWDTMKKIPIEKTLEDLLYFWINLLEDENEY